MKSKTAKKRFDGKWILRIHREKGMGLVVVILVLAFMMGVGVSILTITRTGTEVAGNMRYYQEAFNAAEAGFDAGWQALEAFFAAGGGTFDGMYLKEPTGIDVPDYYDPQGQLYYFRRRTDEEMFEIFNDNGIDQSTTGVLFFNQTYINDASGNPDNRFTYTVFLIDDEASFSTGDPTDVLMVCIGKVDMGGTVTTSRIEVELALTSSE